MKKIMVMSLLLVLTVMASLAWAAPAQPSPEQVKAKAVPLIRQHAKAIFSDTNAMVIGNPTGKISLVEFYDNQCDNCRATESKIEQLEKSYPDLRIVLRPLPILGYYSRQSALATLAANGLDHNKLVVFHHILMNAPLPFNSSTIKIAAQAAGYDTTQLEQAMKGSQYQSILSNNFNLAQMILKPSIGYVATPIIIVAPSNIVSNSSADIEFILGRATEAQLQQAFAAAKKGM